MERLTRNGIVLSFEDAGKGAPPILLIHDLGCDHTSLQPQLEHFRRRHRVVAVDLPGHGQSEQPAHACTPAGFAEDLVWLCHESGLYRPVALGQGFGATIALELVAAGGSDLLAAVVALDVPMRLPPAPAPCSVPVLYVTSRRPRAAAQRINARVDAFVRSLPARSGVSR